MTYACLLVTYRHVYSFLVFWGHDEAARALLKSAKELRVLQPGVTYGPQLPEIFHDWLIYKNGGQYITPECVAFAHFLYSL